MDTKCPVCEWPKAVEIRASAQIDRKAYSCERCGSFTISKTALPGLKHKLITSEDGRPKLSHAINRHWGGFRRQRLNLTTKYISAILERDLPSPPEQADLLIRFLGRFLDGPGENFDLLPDLHQSVIGARSEQGFRWILEHLEGQGLLKSREDEFGGPITTTLTFQGWERYVELGRGGRTYRQAFMAMQFNEDLLDRVFKDIFKPNVRQAGFTLRAINEDQPAGLIDDQLRVRIQSSDFLIADLTHDNSGAYWEAGYAEGLGKPVIYTCEKSKFEEHKTHFDTNHHLTIVWDQEAPEEAGERLKATIRATLPEVAIMVDEEAS